MRAEALRRFILAHGGWDSAAEMALHFAARREHWAKLIQPALVAGLWVICDRFHDSTYAYQVAGQGAEPAVFEALRQALIPDAVPDFTFVLDLPEGVGLRRARDANRYEAMGGVFHARVRQGFLARAAAERGRITILDATRPVNEVSATILHRLLDVAS